MPFEEGDAPLNLHGEVLKAQLAPGRLAHQGERFDQKVGEPRLSLGLPAKLSPATQELSIALAAKFFGSFDDGGSLGVPTRESARRRLGRPFSSSARHDRG